jgi:hypothetical protein
VSGVTSRHFRDTPYADCDSGDFYFGDGSSSEQVRREARKHVACTGHVVTVTVEDVTKYEPAPVQGTPDGTQ